MIPQHRDHPHFRPRLNHEAHRPPNTRPQQASSTRRQPSRVELYAAIRRDATCVLPDPELELDPFKPVIDEILVADLDAPRTQRHTATRISARLIDEQGMADISYPVVRAYAARRKPEIRLEQGRGDLGGFVPHTHLPGREAGVDFGGVAIRLRGELVTVHLFSLRMLYPGKAVHRVSATGGQEAFFEAHVHAFTVLGGVPAGKIRCDNLKAAVAQVIGFSRQRVEADRWRAFKSHFDLDAFYCQPGIKGANEKGGVEGDIGRFRRNHLVPVPEVDSLTS